MFEDNLKLLLVFYIFLLLIGPALFGLGLFYWLLYNGLLSYILVISGLAILFYSIKIAGKIKSEVKKSGLDKEIDNKLRELLF